MGAYESGTSLLELMLAKLPEDKREAAKALFTAPEAKDAVTLIGDSALARSDYSRHMDDLKKQQDALVEDYNKLTGWYDQNKPRLDKVNALEAEIARLKGESGDGNNPPPIRRPGDPPPASGMSKEDLLKLLEERDAQRDQGYAEFAALQAKLASQHMLDFKEALDVRQLIDHAWKNKVTLDVAYEQVHKEKLDAKRKAEDDARVNKLVDERYAQRMKESGQPFPIRSSSPSVLDVIEQKKDTTQFTVDSAVAEYERLQALRG